MEKQPLVTVLMPCYNAMPYLPEALESIINQTYSNLEILCINDGSTDETGEVLERYAKIDSRIRVIHNTQNIKLIQTLNKGIDLATGEYIARMDADDISKLNRIEIQLKTIINQCCDLVSNGYYLFDSRGNKKTKHLPKCYSSLSCLFASFFITPIAHASVLIKSNVLKTNHYSFVEQNLHAEDYELWTRLLSMNVQFRNISDVLYSVRINPASVSHQFESSQVDNFISLVQQHHKMMGVKPIERNLAKVLGLRADKELKPTDLKEGLWILIKLMHKYLNQASNLEKQEIRSIAAYVFISIILQGIKRGSISYKLACLWQSISRFKYFLNRQAWLFLKHR
jgi:glycosyltransferase involved in cell wall biosynthesis